MERRVEADPSAAKWLETLDGDAPVLLIAPHGGRAGAAARATLHPKVNDLETAEITRELAHRLGAPALINAGIDRNELDCNRLSQLSSRAPWLLEMLAEHIERIIQRHGRATVLLLHGWNIIEPRVDFGLGVREAAGKLRPPAGAHVSASDEFIHGAVARLAARLRAAEIQPTFGLRYPGAAAQNLLQAFTPRHGVSQNLALQRLGRIAAAGLIDALQLEMSVTVRLPGVLRRRNLDALSEIFSRTAMPLNASPATVSVIRESASPVTKKPVSNSAGRPPLRIGVEFYDPAAHLGGMASFDFGPNAAGGRIMLLFDRRRVALFTAEGNPQRSADQVSLGPMTLNAHAERGGLTFRGPAVVVDDGAAYLSVERALAEGRVDPTVEISASLELDGSASSFGALLAKLESILASAYRVHASPDELVHAVPPHASFGRLRGFAIVDGTPRELDAVARIGVSFTGLGPQKFDRRRMLWACFSDAFGHNAVEARALDLGDAGRHQIARILKNSRWLDCEIADFELETRSPYSPPERIAATLVTETAVHASVVGAAETFMTLSRPGPDGIRIHTSLGFATYRMGEAHGVGMYEYSRRVDDSGRSPDPGDSESD